MKTAPWGAISWIALFCVFAPAPGAVQAAQNPLAQKKGEASEMEYNAPDGSLGDCWVR